jgi:phosphoglucosamine mutase
MEKERTLFGTDGIRGIANRHPMTPEIALRIGKATALYFKRKNSAKKHRIVIGKDTRLSGYMFESALTSGIVSMGVDVLLAGPIPTPGISHLTRSMSCDAGIVISASHNPAEDNGIKIFASDGYKLSDEQEHEIEKLAFSHQIDNGPIKKGIGKAWRVADVRGRYIEFLKNSIDNTELSELTVAIDAANGAAYAIAPAVFSELGAEIHAYGVTPNGWNINKGCGALHPEYVQDKVVIHGCDIGIALDGDADRVVVCDEEGKVVHGDKLIAMLALSLKERNMLTNNTIVVTVMSTAALDEYLEKHGIKVVRTAVGDRYVIEKMRSEHHSFGGEQSGHLIFGQHAATGDGILAALQLARIMVEKGRKLSKLSALFEPYPQVLVNVKVKEKRPFDEMPEVKAVVKQVKEELKGKGRVLLRYSGTEQVARVMVEAKTEKKARRLANMVAEAVKNAQP